MVFVARHLLAVPGLLLVLTACTDKPAANPDNNANRADNNNNNNNNNTVLIPTQPASSNAAPSGANPNPNPNGDPATNDERAKLREKFDRLAEERDKIDRASRGETSSGDSTDGADPVNGKFTLADATATLPGSGGLLATIKTNMGTMKCKLFDDKAPVTVANFVGLARGVRPYKSPTDGRWVKQPIYDGTTFHRVIKGFMIQGGDPKGNGTGEPGYVIPDEVWPGAKHDHAGQLCMANRGPNTNGAQFFITDASVPHLDKGYTIFGECAPVSIVRAIASVPLGAGDRPKTPVTIDKVEITRDVGAAGGKSSPSTKPGPADRM